MSRPSESLLDNFWLRMAGLFGHAWVSQYGASPSGVGADTWATALSGISSTQVAHGLRETLALGGEFPPSAPRFRALCLGVPSFVVAQREFTSRVTSPFCRLMHQHVDTFRLRQADQRDADRLLRDAYDLARDHVMRGGALPTEPTGELPAPTEKVGTPATEATVRKHLAEIEAALGRAGACAA